MQSDGGYSARSVAALSFLEAVAAAESNAATYVASLRAEYAPLWAEAAKGDGGKALRDHHAAVERRALRAAHVADVNALLATLAARAEEESLVLAGAGLVPVPRRSLLLARSGSGGSGAVAGEITGANPSRARVLTASLLPPGPLSALAAANSEPVARRQHGGPPLSAGHRLLAPTAVREWPARAAAAVATTLPASGGGTAARAAADVDDEEALLARAVAMSLEHAAATRTRAAAAAAATTASFDAVTSDNDEEAAFQAQMEEAMRASAADAR